jgi:hypothetical protein
VRRGAPTWRPPGTASFVGPAEIMRVNDRLDVLERVPVMVAISGTCHPTPARRVTADPPILWNVRSSAMSGLVHALPQLARKSFSVHAVLFEVVSDHGRHALCPVEHGAPTGILTCLCPSCPSFGATG